MIADSTSEGARAISENFETVRQVADEQHKRTSDSMRHIFEQSTGDAHAMFDQAAERFAEVVDGIKRMTAEMQHELETTRGELRKGILELPQETADSAAQMRRVIVDQIEALAGTQSYCRASWPHPRYGGAGGPPRRTDRNGSRLGASPSWR